MAQVTYGNWEAYCQQPRVKEAVLRWAEELDSALNNDPVVMFLKENKPDELPHYKRSLLVDLFNGAMAAIAGTERRDLLSSSEHTNDKP